jgi:Sensors of blue-light using FAD
MTDGASAEPAPTFQLMYRSHSRIPQGQRDAALGEIFSAARSKNKSLDITGALLITDHYFAQILEGDETGVRSLFERIGQDERHEDVRLVKEGMVAGRTFPRWAMARVSSDGSADIPLHTIDGVIGSAAGAGSQSREQAELLTALRNTIGADTV